MKPMKKITMWFTVALTLIFMAGVSVCAESKVLTAPTGIYQDGASGTAVRIKITGEYGYLNYDVQISTDGTNWSDVSATLTAQNQAQIDNLETGRTYYVRVRSHIQNTDQVSDYTQPFKVVTKPGYPGISAKQTGKAVSSSAQLTWGAAPGARGYQIWYSTSLFTEQKLAGTTTTTSYTLKGLKKDTSYFVTVVPYTIANEGTANQVNVVGLYQPLTSGNDCYVTTLPAKVTGLQTYQWKPNTKKLIVAWKEGNVADGYELIFYNNKGKKVKTATVPYTKSTYNFYTCSKVTKNSYAKVKIRAYVMVNGKKYYSGYTTPIYCVSEPKMNSKGYHQNGKLSFSWKAVSGATGYDVYISTSTTASSFKKVASLGKDKTSYSTSTFKGAQISKSRTYYLYVVAKKKVGSKTYKSAPSTIYHF